MQLISVTVASDTRAALIGDALRSVVDWVDLCLIVHLVDPAATPDRTLAIAREVAGAKFRQVDIPVATATGGMRNAGLDEAARLGGDWAVLLDTDERLERHGGDVRGALDRTPEAVRMITVADDTGTYDKIRFLRLPAEGRYRQDVHEDFAGPGPLGRIGRIRFRELPKTPEQLRANAEAQLAGLEAQARAEPDNPRWRYYHGRTLELLGRPREALAAYESTRTQLTSPGTLAWTHFLMARCMDALGQHAAARELCVRGLAHAPDHPELAWFAGIQCVRLEAYRDAQAWARIAAVFTARGPRDLERTGDREPLAYFEGPWQVMAAACRGLGLEVEAQEALEEVARARGERLAQFPGGA